MIWQIKASDIYILFFCICIIIQGGLREIKTEAGNSPTPLYAPATSSLDIKTEPEDIETTSNHTADRMPSPVLLVTVTDAGFVGAKISWICCNILYLFEVIACFVCARRITHFKLRCVCSYCTDGGLHTKSQSVMDECKYRNRDATTCSYDAAQLQAMQLDTR